MSWWTRPVSRSRSAAVMVLLLIKSLYFVTLMGGVFLYLLRKENYVRIFSFFGVIVPVFAICHYLFLSGAGSDALWLVFPHFIYERMPTIFFGDSLEFDRARWTYSWVPLMVLYSALVVYFSKVSNDSLLMLSSVALSGFLGMLLITEPTSLSTRFFYTAAAIPMALTLYHWLREHYLPSPATSLFSLLPVVLYPTWAFALTIDLLNVPRPDSFVQLFVITAAIGVFSLRRMNISSRPIALYAVCGIAAITLVSEVSSNALLKGASRNLLNGTPARDFNSFVNSYSSDLIQGYSWLNDNSLQDNVVLFGNHYELKDGGFIRSALSGRQMYCELNKYRGLGMQDDYAFRYASTIYFYRSFVESSETSRTLLDTIGDEEYVFSEPTYFSSALSKESEHSLKGKALYYLSAGNNWSWINRPAKLDREIKAYWNDYERMDEGTSTAWAEHFLDSQNISHVVLENSDHPGLFLAGLTDTVFENDNITILRVH